MARPFAVGLHHRRYEHRRDTPPPVAGLHLDLLVQRPLDGETSGGGGEELAGVADTVAQVAEQVGGGGGGVGGGSMPIAHAQQCRVFYQHRFAGGKNKG